MAPLKAQQRQTRQKSPHNSLFVMQFPWSDFDSREPKSFSRESCETLAPFVMALFDGEADEEEIRRARAHLLVCQICAQRYLDWNHARDLLRAVPVPAPPPTQLWRVLMACRLASFARGRSSRMRSSRPENRRAISYAPTGLESQILARTTRVATTSVEVVSERQKRRSPIFALPSLAVPALALWLITLQRDSFLTPIGAATGAMPTAAPVAARRVVLPVNSAVLRHRVRPARQIAARDVISKASAPQNRDSLEISAIRVAPTAPQTPRLTQNNRDFHPDAPRADIRMPRLIATNFSTRLEESLRRETSRVAEVAAPLARAPIPMATLRAAALRAVTAPLRLRVAPTRQATFSDKQEPTLRAARWQLTSPRAAHVIEVAAQNVQPTRVSLPTPAPPIASARLLTENFDNDDARVEEMRSAVEDLRAALDPEGQDLEVKN